MYIGGMTLFVVAVLVYSNTLSQAALTHFLLWHSRTIYKIIRDYGVRHDQNYNLGTQWLVL